MKLTRLFFGMAAAALLAVAGSGCGKSDQSATKSAPANGGIDSRKLQAALASNPSEELRKDISKLQFSVRYRQYVDALAALDRIAAEPSLTDEQKKLVATVVEQVKQAAAAKEAAASAPPASQ